MKYFDFQKEGEKWFVVLPEWTGDKEELEMVSGADIFLDMLAQGDDKVSLSVSTESFDSFQYKLTFVDYADGGGDYHLKSELSEFPVWLCHVVKFVYGDLPKTLFIS